MPFISARDGTQLFWREWGSGEPLLFLNSLGLGTQMWDYQMMAFADAGYRCVGFDRRGHGRSDQPSGGYDHDTFADDVATLIDHLKLTDLTLVGHSMAGGEIVRYLSRARRTPVQRVVLLAPMTPMLRQSPDNPAGVPAEAFEALWALWRQDYAKWAADATLPFFVPETSPALMQWTLGLVLQTSVPVALACSRAMVQEDFRAEMRQLSLPTLLIHGDRDQSAPIEVTGIPSSKLLPNCQFVIYEGAPHGLLYTHAKRLHEDMLSFLRTT